MQLALRASKRLRPHQEQALADVVRGFETHARGQMLMACGTGNFCRRSGVNDSLSDSLAKAGRCSSSSPQATCAERAIVMAFLFRSMGRRMDHRLAIPLMCSVIAS